MSSVTKTAFINEARSKVFTESLYNRYNFEILEEQSQLWAHFDSETFSYAPHDLYFAQQEFMNDTQQQKLILLSGNDTGFTLQDSLLIRDTKNAQVVALYHGWQKSFDSYYMQSSFVHKDYRRQHIYSALLDRILEYTKILGFNQILSCHSPNNNAIIIAKLKKDFKIIGMDVDPYLGTNVWLSYFHNDDLKCAFAFRCSHIAFSKKLAAASQGTAELLLQELASATK